MRHSLPIQFDRDHPVIRQEYAIYTPPVDEMIAKIGDWIDQQKSGGYIYGPSRFGKSRGIKWHVTSALRERFRHQLPLVIWPRPAESHTSEMEFWHQLLLASKFHFSGALQAKRKVESRYLVIQRFITLARFARCNYIVLLIDEAQDLTLREWQWLVGLQNILDWEGYRLSVFSVGSHQMGYRHELLAVSGNAHIAARFFVAHARFHGLASVDEVEYVLQGYDSASEWPQGSRTSYLQYFAPDAFARGERLAHAAQHVWNAFEALLPPGLDSKSMEVPVQYLSHSVEAALFRLAHGHHWEDVISYQSWLNLIADTSFSDHMRIVSSAA